VPPEKYWSAVKLPLAEPPALMLMVLSAAHVGETTASKATSTAQLSRTLTSRL
jgi:hypothetical protein